MNLLALDTCFDACSVAAGRRLRSLTPSISYACELMSTGHAERLMPMIEDVMADVGMGFHDLDRIVVANGPGTFTGTRIAVSAARALALATGAPIVAISSLALMAMSPNAVSNNATTLAVATDARRGEVYFQSFHARSLMANGPPALLNVADAAAQLGIGPAIVAGSGGAAIAALAQAAGCDVHAICPNLTPEAIDMLFVSAALPITNRVAPLYLRPADAKPPAPSPFAKPFVGNIA